MRLRVVDTIEDFAASKASWDELLERSRQNGPFLSHEWLDSWWAAYGGQRDQVRVLFCHQNGTDSLLGAFPTYTRRATGIMPTRLIRYLGDEHAGATRLGCIADRDAEDEVFATIADHLFATGSEWDALELRNMEPDSPFLVRLAERFGETNRPVLLDSSECCPCVALPESWDAYLSSISRRERATVRRLRRDVESLGAVRVEEIKGVGELAGALEDVARMFGQRMSAKFGRPFTASDRYRRFITSVSERFLERGWLRLIFLRIQDQRAAFIYQFRYGDTTYAYQAGFEEGWASHRVGMVLYGHAIERAICEGCTLYNFGPGREQYKYRWGASDLGQFSDAVIYGRSLAGLVGAGCYSLAHRAKPAIKRLIPPPMSAPLAARAGMAREWRELKQV